MTTLSKRTLPLVTLAFGLVATPHAQAPNFDQARDETVALLQDLIRIDTSWGQILFVAASGLSIWWWICYRKLTH